MKAARVLMSVLAGCLVLVASAGQAAAGEGMALRRIMKDLGANMQAVTGAISTEDWPLVERTAPMIADHPQPPMAEKLRIMAFIGTDMGAFKGFDTEVHEAAATMGEAARAGDGEAVISAFSAVQSACYGCHSRFRKGFVEHFYGGR